VSVTTPAPPGASGAPAVERTGHPRLTVLAAALSVLGVLALPGVVAGLADLAVPDRGFPVVSELTDDAQEVVRRTGADVIGHTVIVPVRPGTGVPALSPSAVVPASAAAGPLIDLDVRGLVPMRADVAPPSIDDIAVRLVPWVDRVYADVGSLSIGCLTADDGTCSMGLLVHAGDSYYEFPGQAPARFYTGDTQMEARTYEVLGGYLVVGRMPPSIDGSDVGQVIVSLSDHSIVPAQLSHEVAPGEVVWWSTRGGSYPVSASVFARGSDKLASFVLAGS
jgi:hypothetical protein